MTGPRGDCREGSFPDLARLREPRSRRRPSGHARCRRVLARPLGIIGVMQGRFHNRRIAGTPVDRVGDRGKRIQADGLRP